MIAAIVTIIFTLIIIGVVWWGIEQLLPLIPLAEPFRTLIRVLMIVLLVMIILWVIASLLLPLVGVQLPFFRG